MHLPHARRDGLRSIIMIAAIAAIAALSLMPIAPAAAQGFDVPRPVEPLSEDDLKELIAPIALYPDALLAHVLAASIYAHEVEEAAAFLRAGGSLDSIEAQDWEPSVQAIAQVPEVLRMLDEFPEWTIVLGETYLTQGAELLAAVQALRAIAWENGALTTTPEQVVAQEGTTIVIQPANPEVIFVPVYDPQVVFVPVVYRDRRAVQNAALIGFGTGIVVGAVIWNLDCHWRSGSIHWNSGGVHVRWRGGSRHPRDRDININININDSRPRPGRPGISRPGDRPGSRPDGRPGPGWEGERWRPNPERINRPGGGGSAIDRWREQGRQPGSDRPSRRLVPGRSDGGPSVGGTPPPGAGSRPPWSGGRGDSAGRSPPRAPTIPQPPALARPGGSRPSTVPAVPPTARQPGRQGGFDVDRRAGDFRNRATQGRAPANPSLRPPAGSTNRPMTPSVRPSNRSSAPTLRPAPRPAPRPAAPARSAPRTGGRSR